MHLKQLADLKVAVWGKGREGQALMDFFNKHLLKAAWIEGNDVDLTGFDVVFKSPGISCLLYTSDAADD